ncbi:MAG: hypothetical protein HYV04_07160 [Deltaproteobacteria bacterium]|nr:hypothetical protein [Deltaproteobacteria bacterium]
MKKTVIVVLSAFVGVGLMAAQAFAFNCPKLIKAADESIAKAESAAAKITADREKGRATAMIELAKQWSKEAAADHKEAVDKKSAEPHYRAEAKAKAAKALADMVK